MADKYLTPRTALSYTAPGYRQVGAKLAGGPRRSFRVMLQTRPHKALAVVAMMMISSLPLVASPSVVAQSVAAEVIVYDDELGSGFANWSWAETDFAATGSVMSGTSIMANLGPWEGLSIGNSQTVPVAANAVLTFAIHGGENPNVALRVVAMDGNFAAGEPKAIEVPGGQWTQFEIPLSELGGPAQLGGLWWQEATGSDRLPIFVDNIGISTDPEPGPPPTTEPPANTTPPPIGPPSEWAFEETFDGDPGSPSQDLLPPNMEYAVTHRSHPQEHFENFGPYPADHSSTCAGPNPAIEPLPQHDVFTSQTSSSSNPDDSFFVCKNHMMSSMGNVSGYSVTSFWPRQEFNFADGGVLEFDVNINDAHGNRSWWEVMIVPRDQLKIAAGPQDSPISETYPRERIVLDFRRNVRTVKVGKGALAPAGWLVDQTQRGPYDYSWWRDRHPEDPALDDRRVRRTMRVQLEGDHLIWGIETPDGSFDEWRVDVPGGLPFDQGLVLFKTHAYNPEKDGNLDTYTFHWDNVRFDGPELAPYETYEADDVVYLQRNGDRPIGDTKTVTIDLPANTKSPVLFGQVHQPVRGQVLLSINGGPNIEVSPYEYDANNCLSQDWKSFRLELDQALLKPGTNDFMWTVGPRPSNCPYGPYNWDGFSVKSLQVQTGP